MSFAFALNTVFGPFLVIFLIFADYVRKRNVDLVQRRYFLLTLIFFAVTMLMDFAALTADRQAGLLAHNTLWIASYFYYVFQTAGCWFLIVFCVYTSSKKIQSVKPLCAVALTLITAHAVLLLFNFKFGFYYQISPQNSFVYGRLYVLRLIFSYMPAASLPIAILRSSPTARKPMVFLMLMIFLFIGTGTTIDMICGVVLFTWPCIASSLLCSYFFIITTDAKIDSLTGIGNRYAFDEFIGRLSRTETKETWNIIMIDMDHFKAINDDFGHAAGDMALKDMAGILKACTRGADFVARYGGDEFVLAVNGGRDFGRFLAGLQKAIDTYNETKKRPFKLEMSYGYDTFTTASAQIIQDFMGRIDSLMYTNKTERRKKAAS
jgi:diguanylate cyclase (GGDEF)-like protein